MTYYVASGVENAARVNEAAARLNALGHTRTYDWTRHGSVAAAPPKKKEQVALSEARAVAEAELVLLLLPGGRGTHAELGLAIATAAQKRRILVFSESSAPFAGADGFCVFYHHPAVTRVVCSFEELLARLPSLI